MDWQVFGLPLTDAMIVSRSKFLIEWFYSFDAAVV